MGDIDLTLLGLAESSWDSRAKSDKNAIGRYQIKAALDQWNMDHDQKFSVDDMNKPSLGKMVAQYYVNEYIPEYMRKKKVPDTADNRIAMYNAGPYGARKRIESGQPLEAETQRLQNTYNSFASFDPEGSGYWEPLAGYMGMRPPPGQHWGSREPQTGLIMKGQQHETIDLAKQEDEQKGYQWLKSTTPMGYYHSVPVAPDNYYLNQ